MNPWLLEILRCPRCLGDLVQQASGTQLLCHSCRGVYQIVGGIPRLLGQDGFNRQILQRTREAFGKQWKRYDQSFGVEEQDAENYLAGFIGKGFFKGKTILDAGCGQGRYSRVMRSWGARVVGMDASHSVEAAQKTVSEGLCFIQSDILRPPFKNQSFNAIFSFGVLHHLPAPKEGFCRLSQLLKPGAPILIWVYSDHQTIFRQARRLIRGFVHRLGAPAVFLKTAAFLAALFLKLFYLTPLAICIMGRILPLRPLWEKGTSPEGLRGKGWPLASYAHKPFGYLFIDCFDALNAPLEHYLSEKEVRAWFDPGDFRDVSVKKRPDGSGWSAIGYKR